MQGHAWYDVSPACTRGQQRNVKSARVSRVHSVAIREMGNYWHGSRKDVSCWCRGCEKRLMTPELRVAHRLIVLASVVIVLRSNKAARAYLREGVKQGRVKLTSAFILLYLSLLAPNRQKCGGCG